MLVSLGSQNDMVLLKLDLLVLLQQQEMLLYFLMLIVNVMFDG